MPSTFWRTPEPLVLASGSAARRALLAEAAIPFEVVPATIDERALEDPLRRDGATPAAIALHLARAKASAVSATRPGRLVLGGDQVLALGSRLFTKPQTLAAARTHIETLAGHTHSLHAGWALVHDGVVLREGVDEARLTMRQPGPAFLDAYLAAEGEALLGSVGAYRLEGLGAHLFTRIEGDHSTILGLPILPVLEALRQSGYLLG